MNRKLIALKKKFGRGNLKLHNLIQKVLRKLKISNFIEEFSFDQIYEAGGNIRLQWKIRITGMEEDHPTTAVDVCKNSEFRVFSNKDDLYKIRVETPDDVSKEKIYRELSSAILRRKSGHNAEKVLLEVANKSFSDFGEGYKLEHASRDKDNLGIDFFIKVENQKTPMQLTINTEEFLKKKEGSDIPTLLIPSGYFVGDALKGSPVVRAMKDMHEAYQLGTVIHCTY